MGLFAKLAIGVLVISFFTFVAFFGRLPALRHTPIAWLHRAIWVSIPNAFISLDQSLTGGRITANASSFGNSVWYGKHPTVLIFFFLLLSVSEYLYLPGAWPRLSRTHQTCCFIAIILPYIFLYLASFTEPGTIDQTTHSKYMSHYPYDFTLFHPGQTCRTCKLLKPPRSKHCVVCKRCVAKMDHHCVFINNCVGYKNQHYFLLLLLTTAILTTYGGLLGLRLISETAHKHNIFFSLWKHPKLAWRDWFILFSYGIQKDVGIGSVTLLVLMTSPLVWGLLAYHVYLIYCGTTTNESMKWQDWQAEMSDGFAFRRRLSLNRIRDPVNEASWTRWPVDPIQILVRTEDGSTPNDESPPGEGHWEHVWALRDVENIYDIGFWDNMADVFLPHHLVSKAQDLEKGKRSKRSRKSKAQRGAKVVATAT
ncbi:DHHC zinc finger protein [Xylariaceae sp. FL1019]|nr:DHHC zinc finger protein [Xylariaceae sp. FL1019]